MANIKSAKKRARQNVKLRLHNASMRSRTYTFVKRARAAIAACEKSKSADLVKAAQEACKLALAEIDRMVPKGIFHKNKAARLKSRLNAGLKKVSA